MIKIHTTNSNNPQVKKNQVMKEYQSFQNSIQGKNPCFGSLTLQIQRYPTQKIYVKKCQYEKQQQIFQWRKKTEFPIVKIRSWKLLAEKQLKQENFFQILVELQSQLKSLEDIKKIHFFQAIYILKESLIGFQRLFHRFGNFHVSASMIKFNKSNSCKVWINKDGFQNNCSTETKKTEKEFIVQLCNIIWPITVKSKKSSEFFEKIESCKYFFQTIGVIDTFVKSNKINIPNSFQNIEEIKSPLLKTSLNIEELNQHLKPKILASSSKIPTFIKNNQVKKKKSTQTYTPAGRKMTMATQTCIMDRSSLTNISRNLSTNSFLKNQPLENEAKKQQNENFEVDDFLHDLNIRLIEPSPQKKAKNITTTSINNFLGWSNIQNAPESPVSPYGKLSEFDSNQDKKSAFSFHKFTSQECTSPFETSEKMFLTVMKPNKISGVYSTVSPKKQGSPRKSKQLKDFGKDQQSLDDFEHHEKQQTKALPSFLLQKRDKRKLSGDFGNSSRKNQDEIECQLNTPQYGTDNVLKIPNSRRNREYLSKSPSHQLIAKRAQIQSQDDQKQERQFLRQTVMSKNGWKGFQLLNKQDVKESFLDSKQIIVSGQSKTSELPKLGLMGRDIKSSMISSCEFELEFGTKIEKQKCVRNEIMNLLD